MGGYHMKQLKTAVLVIDMQADYIGAVSYTHLTLPTIYSV